MSKFRLLVFVNFLSLASIAQALPDDFSSDDDATPEKSAAHRTASGTKRPPNTEKSAAKGSDGLKPQTKRKKEFGEEKLSVEKDTKQAIFPSRFLSSVNSFRPDEQCLLVSDWKERQNGIPLQYQDQEERLLIEGKDRRKKVENSSAWPYSVHGRLLSNFTGKRYVGSGTLIGPHFVLTAGHNVRKIDTKNKTKEDAGLETIRFCPGAKGNSLPFGEIAVERVFISPLYSLDSPVLTEHDYALLVLKTPIGNKTGWFGMGMFEDDAQLRSLTINVTGYPGDKCSIDDHQMWTMANNVASVNAETLTYDIDTYKGQSGSGAWYTPDRKDYYVVGVHTHGGTDCNVANRLSKVKLETLSQWMKGVLFGQPSSLEIGYRVGQWLYRLEAGGDLPGREQIPETASRNGQEIMWYRVTKAPPYAEKRPTIQGEKYFDVHQKSLYPCFKNLFDTLQQNSICYVTGQSEKGKTLLAARYFDEARKNHAYHVLLWFDIGKIIGKIEEPKKEIEKRRKKDKKVLVILDNVSDLNTIHELDIEPNDNTHVICVCQEQTARDHLYGISLVSTVSEQEAVDILDRNNTLPEGDGASMLPDIAKNLVYDLDDLFSINDENRKNFVEALCNSESFWDTHRSFTNLLKGCSGGRYHDFDEKEIGLLKAHIKLFSEEQVERLLKARSENREIVDDTDVVKFYDLLKSERRKT